MPEAVPYVPAAQGEQLASPETEKRPAMQSLHVAVPVLALYVPALQLLHVVESTVTEYAPAAHGVHDPLVIGK
jgi:hypothetical protein